MTAPGKVDALADIQEAIRHAEERGNIDRSDRLQAAYNAVAELIAAARLVNADHTAPHDCYATGPLTGDPYLDLVRCPGCCLAAALARFGGES